MCCYQLPGLTTLLLSNFLLYFISQYVVFLAVCSFIFHSLVSYILYVHFPIFAFLEVFHWFSVPFVVFRFLPATFFVSSLFHYLITFYSSLCFPVFVFFSRVASVNFPSSHLFVLPLSYVFHFPTFDFLFYRSPSPCCVKLDPHGVGTGRGNELWRLMDVVVNVIGFVSVFLS